MTLQQYHEKRDFQTTREPEGREPPEEREETIFVVQEHQARHHHFDLRLEHDGVLVSFAVPKSIPEEHGGKVLAIRTEDHPLEYANFEGMIPKGEYGAGEVTIWDRGVYEILKWNDGKTIEVVLKGERLRGKYVLVRFKKAGEKNWLLIKARDE